MPKITHKMLTNALRDLEHEGFLNRQVYAVVPPKVEYSLTERGLRTLPLISQLREYGFELMKDFGLDIDHTHINI